MASSDPDKKKLVARLQAIRGGPNAIGQGKTDEQNSCTVGSVGGWLLLAAPAAFATTVTNPICPDNTALFDPGNGQDIVVPPGYSVSVFKSGLNFPTGIAFRTNRQRRGSRSMSSS